jgi:hypothetical protein
MTISDSDYNAARSLLVTAGSDTARNSHVKHGTKGGSPMDHGKKLLQEARDEFRRQALGQKALKSGMIERHYKAIHDAARKMGVTGW